MCGIAGLITSPAKPLPISELSDRINAMQAALVHRGPDHQANELAHCWPIRDPPTPIFQVDRRAATK